MNLRRFDVVILGAGAAGMMCAVEAGRRGRLGAGRRPCRGRRARRSASPAAAAATSPISTPRPKQFLSANPHFCISALQPLHAADFIALVERHGIAWHEKTLGQLFCDGSATQIVDMLLDEMAEAGGPATGRHASSDVEQDRRRLSAVACRPGRVGCASLVVATGGKSIPKMGATGFGYELARAVRPRA